MSQDSNALRASWFNVGDEVVMECPGKFIVRGFGLRYVGRGGTDHKRAGIYIDFNKVQIADRKSGPELGLVDACRIWSENNTDFPMKHGRSLNIDIKIEELPETPFWVGDHVMSSRGQITLCHIEYDHPIKGILYRIGFSCNEAFKAEDLVLMQRGNLWKLEHGEPLDFTDISEEAKFHQSLGMSQKVKHPITGSNLWDIGDAIKAITRGEGHQMKIRDQELMLFVLIKYDNEEFGKRMRAHTIKQLGIEAEDTILKRTQ